MTWTTGNITSGWTSSRYYGYGILFENLPSEGENGASPLLNDGGVNGDEVRWELLSQTGLTVDQFNEDGSFATTGTGSFDYRSYINNVAVGDFTVTVNAASETFTQTISAGIPIPSAASVVTIAEPGTVAATINAGIPKPTASGQLTLVEPALVSVTVSAGIPKPTAAALFTLINGPIQVQIAAGIPKPAASANIDTGQPEFPYWYDDVGAMVADGRFVIIKDESRIIVFED